MSHFAEYCNLCDMLHQLVLAGLPPAGAPPPFGDHPALFPPDRPIGGALEVAHYLRANGRVAVQKPLEYGIAGHYANILLEYGDTPMAPAG